MAIQIGQTQGGRTTPGAVKQVYRVNYGYRALLDWSAASLKRRGTSRLTGPHPFGNYQDIKAGRTSAALGGKKPPQRQGSSEKIPGSMGIYWDTLGAGGSKHRKGKWQKPKGPKGGMGGLVGKMDVQEAIDQLGQFPQQWLYLAAESMNTSAQAPKINWTNFALSSGMELAAAGDNTILGDMEIEESAPGKSFRDEILDANTGFTRLMRGLGMASSDTWIGAFAGKVKTQAKSRIEELGGEFEKYLATNKKPGYIRALKGLEAGEEVSVSEDPQTVEEHAATSGGGFVITAPQIPEFGDTFSVPIDTYSFRNYANPIDLKFNEDVQIGEGPVFRRMDISQSFLLDAQGKASGTHGTGNVEYDFKGVKNKFDVEDRIQASQETQLKTLNSLMRKILKFAEKDLGVQIKDAKTGHTNWQRIRNALQPAAVKALKGHLGDVFKEDLSWILHIIGNLMPGQRGDYANVISILINGQHGTLVLVYSIGPQGMYSGVDVTIFEEQSPLEWISTVAQELGAEGQLDEIMQGANIGQAALGLANVKQFGVLYQATEMAAGNAVHPRFSMGKIIDPAFSSKMDELMQLVFVELTKGVQKSVHKNIKRNAVTYSQQARKFSEAHSINLWHEFAVNFLMGGQTQVYKDISGGDPFWFLWAAPYITSEYHQEGMGKQYAGPHVRMGTKRAAAGGITY
tara:strand:- start:45 stop:2099 length:2055 start_codon:yes stop_codon:yes gene_type:complete